MDLVIDEVMAYEGVTMLQWKRLGCPLSTHKPLSRLLLRWSHRIRSLNRNRRNGLRTLGLPRELSTADPVLGSSTEPVAASGFVATRTV